MALEGTLRDFSLSDIFQLIALQRKTGILMLKGKDDAVTISFLDGKVVNADSEKRTLENQLGNVLLKRGAVSESRLREALQLQRETLQRLGYILIKEKIITKEELREALTQQILEIIYKVFRWRDGEYHFSQETTIEFDREAIIPLTAENILMEGAQMMDEWPIIERKIPSSKIIFEKTPITQKVEIADEKEEDTFDFDFADEPEDKKTSPAEDSITLPSQVFTIYEIVDGKKTVADIVEMSRYNEFETYKALFELLTRNLIQEVEVEEEIEALEEMEEEAEEEVPEKKRTILLPAVIVVVFALIGVFLRPHNPLNGWGYLFSKHDLVDECLYTASMNRIIHLEKAMSIYAEVFLKYPDSLDKFIETHLTAEETLVDPWDRSYVYLHEDRNYYLYGFEPDGKKSLELMTSHPELKGDAEGELPEEKEPRVRIIE